MAVAAALLWTMTAAAAGGAALSGGVESAVVIPIRGVINEYVQEAFERRLEQARKLGATVVIVELDTPGGMLGPTFELTRKLRGISDLKTIAYVNHTAYSAGTMIALACDEVVMAPGAVIGDCAPIRMHSDGRIESLGATERAKAASPVLADFQESARQHGYDPLLVEAMVKIEPSVYLLVDEAGTHKAVNADEYKKLVGEAGVESGGKWKLVEAVDAPDTLLTVYTPTALKLGLAKAEVASVAELAKQRGLNIVATLDPGVGEKVLAILNTGIIRAILLGLFFTCLYWALHAPGHGIAEVVCVVLLAVLVGVPLMTGYAQWWEIAVILVGIALLAIELFVIPGFGVVGIGGILLILFGLLMTFVAPEPGRPPLSLPSLPQSWTSIRNGLAMIVAALVGSLLLCLWLRRYLPRMPYFKGLILDASVGGTDAAMAGSLTNIDPDDLCPAVGARGTALTDLRPGGRAEFRDAAGGAHVIAVVSDSGFIARGSPIAVREAAGNRVVVRRGEEGGA